MWQTLRTVVLQSAAQQAVDSFTKTLHRFDEAFDGLQWLLVRKPDLGVQNSTPDDRELRLYVQAGDPIARTPSIWVVFEVTLHEIIIHDVNAIHVDDPTT